MISGLSNLCQKFDVGMNEIISNYFASIDLGNRQLIHLNKSSKGNSIGPLLGSGCGSVGRAFASSTRDSQFESCHQANFIFYTELCIEWKKMN